MHEMNKKTQSLSKEVAGLGKERKDVKKRTETQQPWILTKISNTI